MATVSVKNLSKHYFVDRKEAGLIGSVKSIFKRDQEQVKAVDDLSFEINEGELVGFIGPNGAGKTTTLKCLSGLLYPDEGDLKVNGFQPSQRKNEFLKGISLVMGQKNQLWWDLPALETFQLNKQIYEIPDKNYARIFEELVSLLELRDILNIQVRKLSLGQRMKCELMAALLHQPGVLFLDEPTIGLDVVMQKKIRDFIKEYNRKFKATVILTSHYMGDVKELCQRVLIIDKGKLVFDGLFSELIKKYANEKIIDVVLSKEIDPRQVERISQVKEFDYPRLKISVKRDRISLVAAEVLDRLPVADLNIEEPAIEDVIRDLFIDKDY